MDGNATCTKGNKSLALLVMQTFILVKYLTLPFVTTHSWDPKLENNTYNNWVNMVLQQASRSMTSLEYFVLTHQV
jgi:hypothetical protein